MGSGVDIGVHAYGHWGQYPAGARDGFDAIELHLRFDVEAADAGGERFLDLGSCLADAGEDDASGISAGANDALEFTAGDDIEAGAEIREQP